VGGRCSTPMLHAKRKALRRCDDALTVASSATAHAAEAARAATQPVSMTELVAHAHLTTTATAAAPKFSTSPAVSAVLGATLAEPLRQPCTRTRPSSAILFGLGERPNKPDRPHQPRPHCAESATTRSMPLHVESAHVRDHGMWPPPRHASVGTTMADSDLVLREPVQAARHPSVPAGQFEDCRANTAPATRCTYAAPPLWYHSSRWASVGSRVAKRPPPPPLPPPPPPLLGHEADMQMWAHQRQWLAPGVRGYR
jgi:hypothetical protein